MASKKTKIKLKKSWVIGLCLLVALPIILFVFLASWLFLTNRFYPNIQVGNVPVGFLTRAQALEKINTVVSARKSQPVVLDLNTASLSGKQSFEINLNSQNATPAIEEALDKAFNLGRKDTYFPQAKVAIKFEIDPPIKKQLKNIGNSINEEAIDSTLKIENNEITVSPSQDGLILDEDNTYAILNDYLNGANLSNTNLPLKKQEPRLSYNEAASIKKRLDEVKDSPLKLTFEDLNFTLDLDTILSLIDLENSQDSIALLSTPSSKYNVSSVSVNGKEISDSKLTLSPEKLKSYLNKIASSIDRPVQEPLFSVDPGSDPAKPKISEFRPPVNGRELQVDKAVELINLAMITPGQNILTLPVTVVEPKNKLSNELGIKELIGRGVSNFAGSIENRKYNVALAASKINGVIIAPGEEFSFVNTVGDITAATGFKQAYVIKSGRTVLDDGGGVCQVSTTIYRSALNSGLPITARTAHAYRVGYYEQGFPPGLDATIFYPSVDFRFKNDTGHHILIQAYVTGTTLTVDLYGTSDGRTVAMTKPVITNTSPAPPEIRQDDPTLPKGTVKQVDFAANGATVVFNRTVSKNGVPYINETIKSVFRPWQAVYLVGTGG